MASIWTIRWSGGGIVLALTTLTASAAIAGPARTAERDGGKHASFAHSRFDLAAGPSQRRIESARQERPVRPPRQPHYAGGETSSIEGPSWSYQTSRRGPTFEMGALGGGAMPDAPFLAHVAMAWKF